MLHIYHGDDDFSQEEEIRKLQKALGPQETASLNTERLDAPGLSPQDLIARCSAAPFLAEGRLIVVQGLLSAFEPPEGPRRRRSAPAPDPTRWRPLVEFIAIMPTTTTLVLRDGRIRDQNSLLRLLRPVAQVVRTFPPLRGPALQRWVRDQVAAGGGQIQPEAVRTLADAIGGNLWAMSNEIDKLLLYCQDRAITREDVALLGGYVHEEQIFAFADAFIEGRYTRARRQLSRILEGGAGASQILGTLGRQVRLVVQARDIGEREGSRTVDPREREKERQRIRTVIQQELGLQDWQAERTIRQAQTYTLEEGTALHRRLLEADVAIKTGRLTEETALELLLFDGSAHRTGTPR